LGFAPGAQGVGAFRFAASPLHVVKHLHVVKQAHTTPVGSAHTNTPIGKKGVHFMTRVTRGFVAKKRRKRVLKLAKGFRGSNSVLFRTAQQRTLRALSLAYRDRRLYKRTIRSLWIRRINSFLRDPQFKNANIGTLPTSYSSFIHQLKKANISLNRKVLAQLAVLDPMGMKQIAESAAKFQ